MSPISQSYGRKQPITPGKLLYLLIISAKKQDKFDTLPVVREHPTVQQDKLNQTVQQDKLNQTVQQDKLNQTVQQDKLNQTVQQDKLNQTVQQDKLTGSIFIYFKSNSSKEVALQQRLVFKGSSVIMLLGKPSANHETLVPFQVPVADLGGSLPPPLR